MKFFVKNNQIVENKIYIKDSDVNHIKNVLRKNAGDRLCVVSDGIEYEVEIDRLSSDNIECNIIDKKTADLGGPKLTIFQGLAKADKIEYIIQKCSELGVEEIVPVEFKRCVVKLDGKDKLKKIERWQKIAEVAAKQSLRNDILKVQKIINFNQLLENFEEYDYVIMAYEKEEKSLKSVIKNIKDINSKIAVVIGPEGGIDELEAQKMIDAGAESVSLGKRILRTETAPVAISAIIMYELEMWLLF